MSKPIGSPGIMTFVNSADMTPISLRVIVRSIIFHI